ncbi:MAG: DUF4783 domain-containing protein [Bacteroidales bacterium]|jgi:hypothetical protein|nr:DUF4783 domain-containing protein [Bacteroidales bacterium]
MLGIRSYKKIIAVFVTTFLFSFYLLAQTAVMPSVIRAFEKGNSDLLSQNLNTQVEMVLPNHEDIYSKSQASILLKQFFENNKVVLFKIVHQGGRDHTKYAIGKLETEKSNYRVYFMLKSSAGKYKVHLLKIEEE